MTLVSAAYVRTSQDKDDAFSLSSQLSAIQEYATEQGMTIGYTFQEEYTGKTIDRPELNKLMALVHNGSIGAIIVFDATRLARKVGVAEYILDLVFESDIQLHLVSWGTYVKNNTRDIKTFYDEAVYAHIERMKIIERLARGKKDKLSQGKWLCQGVDKYGYKTVGTKRNQCLAIVPDEQAVITAIYTAFAIQGHRVPDIADYLQESGYATPSKAKGLWRVREDWSPSMVYSILKDECYTGRFYANQWTQVILENGKHSTRKNKREDMTLMAFPDLRIVSDELFTAAQQLLQKGHKRFAPNPTNVYLMNRRITCAECRMSFTSSTSVTRGTKYSYYVCNSMKLGRKNSRDDKHSLAVRCREVDDIVYTFVIDLLNNPDKVLKELQQKQREQVESNAISLENVATAKRVLARYEDELKSWGELYIQKLITLHILAEKKAELDRHISAAKEIVAEYESAVSKHILTDADIKRKVKEIKLLKKDYDECGSLSVSQTKDAIQTFNIHAVIGRHDNRVYCGIVWYGETSAFYCDTKDCLTPVAINSTFLSTVEHKGSSYGSGVWLFYLDSKEQFIMPH